LVKIQRCRIFAGLQVSEVARRMSVARKLLRLGVEMHYPEFGGNSDGDGGDSRRETLPRQVMKSAPWPRLRSSKPENHFMRCLLSGLLAVALVTTAPRPSRAVGDAAPAGIELPRQGFELIANARGVAVYKNSSSDTVWIGAVGLIPAPPAQVYAALLQYERQVGKIGRVSEATVLSRGSNDLFVYERLNLPVISDRDFVIRVTYGEDVARRWITYRAVSDRGPKPRDGIVRVVRNDGEWELVSTQDGRATLARCEFRINLGGRLPLWMAKAGAGREIPQLYSEICKLSLGSGKAGTCP
jgi:hypothetical protein